MVVRLDFGCRQMVNVMISRNKFALDTFTQKQRSEELSSKNVVRSSGGFSLVAVTALGVVTMMWLFAISASVLPMYQRAANGQFTTLMRSAAEAGLDYAVAQLNSSISNGAVTSTLIGGSYFPVPAVALGNNGVDVSVKVVRRAPPSTSAIYTASSDPNDWYVVTAKAEYAGMQKKIRVILTPNYNSGSGANPYFHYALFGQKSVSMTGNSTIDGYNYNVLKNNGPWAQYGGANVDNLGGDIGSNALPMPVSGSPVILSGNANIKGSLKVPITSVNEVRPLLNASGNATIRNQLISNGAAGNGNAVFGPNASVQNQGTNASPPRTFTGLATDPGIINSSNNPVAPGVAPLGPYVLPPALGVPQGATVVNPTITKTGNGGNAVFTVAQPAANTVVNMGALAPSGNQVYRFPPGDYQLSSLTIAGNVQVQLIPGSNGQYGQVRFFMVGNSSTSPIQLSGNAVTNNSHIPGNFQLWYGGSQNVSLSGNANFYGVLYAPQANVSMSGNGQIFGAVVGYTINNSGNAAIHFDESLASVTNQWASYSSRTLTSLQTITWQEPRSILEDQRW